MSSEQDNRGGSDAEPTSSSAHEMSPTLNPDGIRRSKRKKFHLDFVAAAHGENQKMRDSGGEESDDDGGDVPDFDEEEEEMELEEPEADENMEQGAEPAMRAPRAARARAAEAIAVVIPDEVEELGRGHRNRRSTNSIQAYQTDAPDHHMEHHPNTGPYRCKLCPIRYTSKSSLANHMKMHNGGSLQFACELCDFSASTTKSLNGHMIIHRRFGVVSPQISPSDLDFGGPPGPSGGRRSPGSGASGNGPRGDGGSSGPSLPSSTSSSAPSSTSSSQSNSNSGSNGTSSNTSRNNRSAAPRALNTSVESSTSNASLGAPQLAVEPSAEQRAPSEDVEEDAPILRRLDESEDEDDGPPILEREVPAESPEPQNPESAVRKSGRVAKPTPKVLEKKKTRGPYKKKNKQQQSSLTVDSDVGATSSESGQNSPVLSGSLPTSSASSVTPPPVEEPKKSHKKKVPPPETPPASRESSEELEPASSAPKSAWKKKKGRVQCKNCPYSCSSPSRLSRHMQGHLLREGYICPVEGCAFMCRKQGFIAKHYILHGKKLPSTPKYCRKTLKAGKWVIEECEDPMMVSLNLKGNNSNSGASAEDVEEEEERDEMADSTMDSGDVTMKEEKAVDEPEDVKPSTNSVQKDEKIQKTPKTPKKAAAAQKRKLAASPKKTSPQKLTSLLKSPPKKTQSRRLPASQAEMRAQAQIRSHKNVEIDGFHYKQCNIGDCEFRTATLTQIVAHKIHSHGAADPLHQFLCYSCGYRTRDITQYRTHKLTAHLSSRNRYHRTFHLKELVGDKFFIRYFTVGRPIVEAPKPLLDALESPIKTEAPPTLFAEVPQEPITPLKIPKQEPAAEPMDIKPTWPMPQIKQEIPDEMQMEDDDDDGDKSFDSNFSAGEFPGIPNLTAEQLILMGQHKMTFCCRECPYKSPTTNRLERHYAKHFTDCPVKCTKCSWTCRSQRVMAGHHRMHEQAEREEAEKNSMAVFNLGLVKMEPVDPEIEERMAPELENEIMEMETEPEPPKLEKVELPAASEEEEPSTLFAELQSWCLAEKLKRPELEEQFTRKYIDTVKGFQCSDCPYTSKYRGDMRSHKKRHDIEQSFRCVQCTYSTNRPVSLKDHLKQHGAVNRALVAEASGANPGTSSAPQPKYPMSQSLKTSQGVHLGTRYGLGKDRIYACSRCPYVSVSLGCLWRHYRNHRDKPRVNVCSNCTYSSLDSRKMDEHLLIHLSLGANDGQQIPFVKRVDTQGRPVSSLMDLSEKQGGEKKTPAKRKAAAPEEKHTEEEEVAVEMDSEEEEEELEIQEKPKRNQRIQKIKEEDKEFRPSSSSPAPKRRKVSTEPSPEPETSQPTRQLSERATRNRINYSLLSRNGSGKPTPSSSSANLESLVAAEIQGQENEFARQADEPDEISHWRIRSVLNKEFGNDSPTKCQDCPYKTSDTSALEKHRYYHTQKAGGPRPYACSDCSFNTFTPTALLQHLKLHSDGFVIDPMVQKHQRLPKNQKKGDVIPPGAEGLYCRNCPYKTANKRAFQEHVAYHRHLLINRILVSLKRQPPKEEYQRPKLKHQFVARNAKYCKKCTFKCVSHSSFIEHLDRHGWEQLYKCHICDYSDNNKSVVDFHQLTHHIVRDQTLHGINQASKFRLENGKIQRPETAKIAPTPEEFVVKTRGLVKCSFCDYFCHVSSELAFHMTVKHLNEPNAEETISHLSMGLIPPQATVTTV